MRDGYYVRRVDGRVHGPSSGSAFARGTVVGSDEIASAWRVAGEHVYVVSVRRHWAARRLLSYDACTHAAELLALLLGGGTTLFALLALRASGELEIVPTSALVVLAALVAAIACMLPRAARRQGSRWRDASSEVMLDECV